MTTYERAVTRLAGGLMLSLSLALVALFLVIDFGDWLRIYTGKPVAVVAELYWYRSHLALVQFAPAAMVLAGGVTVTLIRRRGEWTALKALGASPSILLRPIVLVAAVGSLSLVAVQEWVVSRSGPTIDRMMLEQFGRWGDFAVVYSPRRWFRAGPWVINVRGEAHDQSLDDVRLFEVDPHRGLTRWVEAERLIFVSEGRWRVEGARSLELEGPEVRGQEEGVLELAIPLKPEITRLTSGRSEWLPLSTLIDQLDVLATLQLPTQPTRFAVHHRWASALVALLAALLTALLALADRQRPSMPRALISGGVLYGSLFVLAMIARSLALNGRLPVALAAWLVPALVAIVVSLVARRAWRLA